MAVPAWPDYAPITSSIEISAAPNVARTEFDDGAVRQARRVATPVTRVAVEAEVLGRRLPELRAWAAAHADRYFRMRMPSLGTVGMRVVGGVGGITYEQVARAPGRARWRVRMTLEDAQGTAQGAPFFAAAVAREVVLASKAVPTDLVLPAALGGAGSVRYSIAPPLPQGLVVDATTRRVTGTPAEAVPQATHMWTATDAYGRAASTELPFAVAFRAHKNGADLSLTAGVSVRLLWPFVTYLPSAWYTPADHTALDYVEITAAGQAALSIGVLTPPTALRADLLARLRFRAQLFQRPERAVPLDAGGGGGGPDHGAGRRGDRHRDPDRPLDLGRRRMTATRYRRAGVELAPTERVVTALEVRHPDVPEPVRVAHDTAALEVEGESYIPLAFRARLAADVEGRAPAAEIAIDNVGRVLMRWVTAAQGGSGATVRVMQVLVPAAGVASVEWEVTADVLGVRADQRQVVVRLGYDPLLTRPAVVLRYDPQTAPGLF